MRFACDSCSAKFQIADEKIRGKVVAVKCSKCGSRITLNGKALEQPIVEEVVAPTRIGRLDSPEFAAVRAALARDEAETAAAAAAPDLADGWYAMIGGQQVGPMTAPELRQAVVAGTLTAETFAWIEGQADWLRASEIDALKPLLANAAAPAGTLADAQTLDGADETGTSPASAQSTSGVASGSAAVAKRAASSNPFDQIEDSSDSADAPEAATTLLQRSTVEALLAARGAETDGHGSPAKAADAAPEPLAGAGIAAPGAEPKVVVQDAELTPSESPFAKELDESFQPLSAAVDTGEPASGAKAEPSAALDAPFAPGAEPSQGAQPATGTNLEDSLFEGEFDNFPTMIGKPLDVADLALARQSKDGSSGAASKPAGAEKPLASAAGPSATVEVSESIGALTSSGPGAQESALDPFNDPTQPGAKLSVEEAAAAAAPAPKAADPFAGVKDAPNMAKPAIGEQTRFLMQKAGVTRRNPAWKIALTLALGIGLPVGVLWLLSQLRVVAVEVTELDQETGAEVVKQVSPFSSQGMSGLRNKLLGKKEETKAAEAAAPKAPRPKPAVVEAVPAVATGEKPSAARDSGPVVARPNIAFNNTTKTSDIEAAKALWGEKGSGSALPNVREDMIEKPQHVDGAAGLDGQVVAQIISKNLKAFQVCNEDELRRNPSFKGGKIKVVVTVGASGTVTKASVDRSDIEDSALGACLRDRAKRIAFPSFEGEPIDVEIPLVLSQGT